MKLFSLLLAAMLVATATLAAAPVAAQETSGNETVAADGPDGAPDELEIVVDDEIALVDHGYRNGVLELEFYASENTIVSVAGIPDTSEDTGAFDMGNHRLREDRTTVVEVESETGASFWSSASIADDQAYYVRVPSNSLVPGPYDGRDVVLGASAGAFGVGFAVLFGAAKLKYAGGKRGERKA